MFDEDQVLKQRVDSRQRLKQNENSQSVSSSESWITEPKEADTSEDWSEPVNSSAVEPQDFWKSGPGNQVRRIHMVPRKNWFVPIGVAGCPVGVFELAACREIRVSGEEPCSDFWKGTRGAAPLPKVWTGETIFYRRSPERSSAKKEM